MVYLVVSYDYSDDEKEKVKAANWKDLMDGWTNKTALWDFATHEGMFLTVVLALFYGAKYLND